MATLSKNGGSVFEKLASIDYRGKRHNLPKINLLTPESGREVNVIEAKITKGSNVKKPVVSTPSKKESTPGKIVALSEKKATPYLQKKMDFNLRVTPQTSKTNDFVNYKTTSTDDFSPRVNYSYGLKGLFTMLLCHYSRPSF